MEGGDAWRSMSSTYRRYDGRADRRAVALPDPAALRLRGGLPEQALRRRSSRSASLPPLVGAVLIYLHHNLAALEFLGPAGRAARAAAADRRRVLLARPVRIQGALALPARRSSSGRPWSSPDLRNNGLPLYLSRPFTRSRVRARQDVGAGDPALGDHLGAGAAALPLPGLAGGRRLARPTTCGSAGRSSSAAGSGSWCSRCSRWRVSAWVKWKPVARIALLVVFFVLAGFGAAINEILDTRWGSLLDLRRDASSSSGRGLFGVERSATHAAAGRRRLGRRWPPAALPLPAGSSPAASGPTRWCDERASVRRRRRRRTRTAASSSTTSRSSTARCWASTASTCRSRPGITEPGRARTARARRR